MRLHSLKTRFLGCYQCFHIWNWFNAPDKPEKCPKCLSTLWDKHQVNKKDRYISIYGHKFLLIKKIEMGRRRKTRTSLELAVPELENWIQMYDLYYKCVNCGEVWIGLTDDEDNIEEIEVAKDRVSIECFYGTNSAR